MYTPQKMSVKRYFTVFTFPTQKCWEEGGHKKKGKYNILIGHTCVSKMQE